MKLLFLLSAALIGIVSAGASVKDLLEARELHDDQAMTGLNENDIAILKFAYALECLEGHFYSYAAYGEPLPANITGNGPLPIGGMKAQISPLIQSYAEEIARDEIAHVGLLYEILGGNVSCPLVDIGPAFAHAADAAFNTTLTPQFSPYVADSAFLLGAFIFEDVGVTGYHGAAPLISSKDILTYATGIMGTEAYHAGAVRAILASKSDYIWKPYTATDSDIVDAISALRAAVGGGKDQGINYDGEYANNLVPADENALVYSRTTDEVLAIVYLGSSQKPAGFFPNGISVEPLPYYHKRD